MQVNKVFSQTLLLMGNRFSISVVAEEESWALLQIEKAIEEVRRIESLLTTFNENSLTNQVNAMAGIEAVQVSDEFFALVERANRISVLTDGTFDLSYGSLDKRFWNFDKEMKQLPDKNLASEAVSLINYRNIQLDSTNKTVFLKKIGMRIGFGGIGKGYAAERAKHVLIELGVKSGIVNASGDLTTWGTQPNGKAWTISVANPDNKFEALSYLSISGLSVATSGNYEKYVIIDGKKYSHTINPKTGFPVTGIKSVTIICPNAELADAMATPVTILGVEAGLSLINQMKQIACIIIDDENQVFTSKNINLL